MDRMSSGISSLCALYASNCSWRWVEPPGGSKTTAIWVGFSVLMMSIKTFVNPKAAEVFSPLELMRGFLANAK